MVEFERGLVKANGQCFGYVRPLSMVTEDDWIALFEGDLGDRVLEKFYLLVDLSNVEDDFGLYGMSKFVELIKKLGFGRTRIAVLPPNQFYEIVLRLFEQVGKQHEMDLEAQAFDSNETAVAWLTRP
ncbi:MAG: hypothetical protein HOB82_07300 [Alphaproteobacteria bacterium]|jgi:hypothetical protein|nr:hypothetical protein [Alphaproteobacteria bacterium]MBT5860781.1 hypothetical protein [Alphaproteobacteria bacterium]